jgi:hypothetical protein
MTFRRLLPTAVAAVTLASSAPFLAPAMAHAHTGAPRPERPEHVRPANPGKIPALVRTDITPGVRLQGVSAT